MPSILLRAGRPGLILLPLAILQLPLSAQDRSTAERYVTGRASPGSFALVRSGRPAALVLSSADWAGVRRAAASVQSDIERVTGARPALVLDSLPVSGAIVIVGTLGKSPLIDRLVHEKRIDGTRLAGRWETFVIQSLKDPWPGVERALVIAGSDKRGTIFGLYDLSAQMGVSPWYWWADVPVRKQSELFVLPGLHTQGEPAIKYRGFFINDEAPALSGWVRATFGGFNHQFYERVFELLLRLKGNYLWPAMWGNAFNDDDKLNPQLANEYGVVMGTSHHEPMLRAQQEWRRYGKGPWSYTSNADTLRKFWRDGIRNMGSHESIVTLGMRGDGDMPMTEHGNIELLERIVSDQRRIIAEVTGRDATATPQLWALYKEVQEYYDRGMRVPDDVTLLFADDNWGNIRRLPKPGQARAGGYGVYYHYDYVGGPRNYKWINTNQIERVWEQMQRAYNLGARTIWIVNVGDIKPMEFPLQFFLDHAWNPSQWPVTRLADYARTWAEQQFGRQHGPEIGRLLSSYTRFNARRKPELLSPTTYSLSNYGESERVVQEYRALEQAAERINRELPAEYRAAFYQLVLHPIQASANLNDMYFTVALNQRAAAQGRASTNELAERAHELFARDARISAFYNDTLAGGKWHHMMDQTHIGYTGWQQPPTNVMPAVSRIDVPVAPGVGVALEGSDSWWPHEQSTAQLPPIDRTGVQTTFIDVFNRGQTSFEYSAQSSAPWLRVTPSRGRVNKEQRLLVSVDWTRVSAGQHNVPITIAGAGTTVTVNAVVRAAARTASGTGFLEANGYVSMEAQHYTRAVNSNSVGWLTIPNLSRTLSAVTAVRLENGRTNGEPRGITHPAAASPRLDYNVLLAASDSVTVHAYFSPTLDYHDLKGLRYGISFDNEPPQIVNVLADTTQRGWERAVSQNVRIGASRHKPNGLGAHVLKFWFVDPGLVLQKIVIDTGGLRPSYLGPPESSRRSEQKASR
jgi:glycosyl hydrolase family 115 (putative glucuronidase)/glycosyl hydrolase family 115/BACON domain-containing protein